jgi:hypothetical protein
MADVELAKLKNIYKDVCPRCKGKVHFLTNCNDDIIVMCDAYACQFCVIYEGNFTFISSG